MAIEFAGELHNNAGAAIEGATVDLFARNTATESTASPSSPDTTNTDSDGKWAFSKAAQGMYDIRIKSGTSVRWRIYDDAIQMEEIEVAMLAMRNPGNTFKYDITPAAIAADRVLNLPLTTATATLIATDTPIADAADIEFGTSSDALMRWSTADSSNHSFVIALGDSNQALHIMDASAVATDWNISATTHPNVYVHSNTTPATDYLRIGDHDGTTAYVDVVGGTTLALEIAGNTELTITSAGLNVPANSDINFTGTTGTNDIVLTDSLADALSITRGGTDMVVFNSSTPSITFTPATTFSSTIAAASGSTVGNLTLANGSITDSSGALDFGNESLTTTGAADLGATVVDSLSVSDADITNVGDIALDTISADGSNITIQPSGVCFLKPSGMTSNYAFTDRSDTILVLQNQTAGGTSQLEIYAADGDSTDQVGVSIWPKGTPGSITNRELFNMRYATGNTRFQLETEAGGDGTARNLAIMDNGSDWMEFVAGGGVQFDKAANVYIQDTSNANMTTGLTINQAAADDQILSFKSSDINTGFTSGTNKAVEVDDFAIFQKRNATLGGLQIQAMAEDAVSNNVLRVHTNGGQAIPAKTTAAEGLIHFQVAESNGSNALANITSEGNVFAITARVGGSTVARFVVDEDGDVHSPTTDAHIAFADSYDDAQLIRAFDHAKSEAGQKGMIREKWDDFIKYNETDLIEAGVLGDTMENGGLLNSSALLRLHNGGIWQGYVRQQEMQERIDTLENKLLALEAK